MRRDDKRHGTPAGHVAGCRRECCRKAKLAYDKRRKLDAIQGIDRRVPTWRVMRRIQALQAIGWSVPKMAEASEGRMSFKTIYGFARTEYVWVSTFKDVDWLYRRLMLIAPAASSPGVTRAKRHAARMGWPPPLAWDDIDDEDEQPTNWQYRPAERVDLVRDYIDRGHGLTEILAILKVNREAFEKWCARNGLNREYSALVAAQHVRARQGRWAS
ncbi:MAG: hypothetical protein CMJ18_07620 [Phycisphaeraceae bacterium]|nr:hypothetical protein [Phycisphaeraceae bacterium]